MKKLNEFWDGLKDMFSARSKALNCLNEFRLDKVVQLIEVKDWEGRYQNEKEFNVNFVNLEDSNFFDSYLIENKKKFKWNKRNGALGHEVAHKGKAAAKPLVVHHNIAGRGRICG